MIAMHRSSDQAARPLTTLHSNKNPHTLIFLHMQVLNRMCSTLVTALHVEATQESVNRAVKALVSPKALFSRSLPQHQSKGRSIGRAGGKG